jgi:glutamate-1-semialdehyde 2,1-aminomutase
MDSAYEQRTPSSKGLRDAFRAVLPGGDTRSVASFAPYPVVVERGAGARIWDVDGNDYLDLLNNYTSLVHGHAHPRITEAIVTAAGQGTVHPAPHRTQLALAELLVERYPAVEQVRFTNSGSEAAILAARLVRHLTGRRRVVLMDGGYHGTGELFADPDPDVVRVPLNDVAALTDALDETVAGVFAEPFLGSAGVIPADGAYLRAVRERSRQVGALFVLDEIQALRSAFHGTHGALGLDPDLLLMGKIIGGGLPVGAVGGQAELLADLASDSGPVLPHSGTFNGNVLSMAAGHVAMSLLDQTAITTLDERASRLAGEIAAVGRSRGLPVSVTRAGSIMHVHFLADAPTDAAAARLGDRALNSALHRALLTEGVYTAPRGMLNLSTALTDDDLDHVRSAYDHALASVAQGPEAQR